MWRPCTEEFREASPGCKLEHLQRMKNKSSNECLIRSEPKRKKKAKYVFSSPTYWCITTHHHGYWLHSTLTVGLAPLAGPPVWASIKVKYMRPAPYCHGCCKNADFRERILQVGPIQSVRIAGPAPKSTPRLWWIYNGKAMVISCGSRQLPEPHGQDKHEITGFIAQLKAKKPHLCFHFSLRGPYGRDAKLRLRGNPKFETWRLEI